MSEQKGFFGSLFDVSFSSFVTLIGTILALSMSLSAGCGEEIDEMRDDAIDSYREEFGGE